MNKLFRPKCLRRVLLCLALLFPIVYLCGGLFFALAGAHGEQLFAEPVYTSEYVEVDNMGNDGSYKLSVNSFENILKPSNFVTKSYNFNFSYENNDETTITIFTYAGSNYVGFRGSAYLDIARYIINENNYINLGSGAPYVITFSYSSTALNYFEFLISNNVDLKLYKLTLVPTEVIPENNSAYTDFIFSEPFAKDNFITSLGKDLVDGSTKGFAPMNELFRFINSNMLHFESTDGLAMFGLGYVYYAVNVLIIYEILILAVKLIMLPLKAVEIFNKSEDL